MSLTYSTVDPLVIKTENRKFGIYNYGTDNLYPNNNAVLSDNSGTLFKCWTTYLDFIFGKGMVENTDFWKMKVNIYGLRVDQLLRRIQKDFSIHEGFAVKIVYNSLMEKVGIVPVDFENCRLAYADDFGRIVKIKYYKDWSAKRIEAKDIKEYDVYNPSKKDIAAQITAVDGIENWNGQILYFGKNGEVKYPHAKFHSVLEDVLTDIAIKKGKNANTSTNFMASHMLQLPYTFESLVDASITDAKERRSEAAKLRVAFTTSLNNFQSAENTGKIVVVENDLKDSEGKSVAFDLQKFDIQDFDKIFEFTEGSVKDSIRGVYKQPKIFHDPVATGFSTEIMEAFYNYYNKVTSRDRQTFEEVFMDLFTGFKGVPSGVVYEIEPLTYLDYDDEEIGGEPLAVTLGVGGTSAMQAVLTDTTLTPTQKVGILDVLFGIPTEDANRMLDINQ